MEVLMSECVIMTGVVMLGMALTIQINFEVAVSYFLRKTMDKDVELKQWPSHDLNMADEPRDLQEAVGDEGMGVNHGRGMKGEGGRWEMKGGRWELNPKVGRGDERE
ncbi:hypothetical protein ACLOJK_032739 [Asimina triloba]